MDITKTHIRLTKIGLDSDATALILPIAGTTFEIAPDYKTVATTASGRVYFVEESLSLIEEKLSVAIPDDE